MTPHDMVGAALSAAEAGLAAGELPIGAVVVMGDEVVGWAYTQDSSRNRRLVHADLLAMITADERWDGAADRTRCDWQSTWNPV